MYELPTRYFKFLLLENFPSALSFWNSNKTQFKMSEKRNKCDFKAMNVAELKKYLQERGVSVSGYLKGSLVEIASAVERMLLPVDPNFEKDQTSDADKLIIHDIVIPDPFP